MRNRGRLAIALVAAVGIAAPASAGPDKTEKSDLKSALNKSYKCTRDEAGAETCTVTIRGTTFRIKKQPNQPEFAAAPLELISLGKGHVVTIRGECFQLVEGNDIAFVTPSLDVAAFGKESSAKCYNKKK